MQQTVVATVVFHDNEAICDILTATQAARADLMAARGPLELTRMQSLLYTTLMGAIDNFEGALRVWE